MAANRNSAAARLEDLRVREDSTLPPEILLPGARQSHDVKCLALGHALRSVPHSPMSFNASDGPNLRIPTKPAMHSNSKPAGYSDLMPATRGVVRMGQFHDVVEGWEGQETG